MFGVGFNCYYDKASTKINMYNLIKMKVETF